MDYTATYFDLGRARSARSASKIVPKLIRLLRPTNVIDVGCGIGTWTRTFQLHGIDDVVVSMGPISRATLYRSAKSSITLRISVNA